MTATDWRPAADQDAIRARARLLQSLRAFFDARGYLEVDTPTLARTTVTDPSIESIAAGARWLQTSPEYAMKRLLAAGSGPIYQIAHAFRDGEAGRWHNPEFTLLEWYVPGYDHAALMDETEALLRSLAPAADWPAFVRISYRDAFLQHLSLDPFETSVAELRDCARLRDIDLQAELSTDGWLDLLMGEVIGPRLGRDAPCFVVDYPPSQAALARVRDQNPPVASRFELYWQGLELANGFHELAEVAEQRIRFQRDLATRRENGQVEPQIDEKLLQALEHGLPDCAGVALGVDRLLALLLGRDSLASVLAFPAGRI